MQEGLPVHEPPAVNDVSYFACIVEDLDAEGKLRALYLDELGMGGDAESNRRSRKMVYFELGSHVLHPLGHRAT